MPQPAVTTAQLDAVTVISLHGEHDLCTADEVRSAVADANMRVVIDLSDATFIDATILRIIIGMRNGARLPERAVAVVAPLGGEPRRVFDLVHAGDHVRIFPSRELALVALTQRPLSFVGARGRRPTPPIARSG